MKRNTIIIVVLAVAAAVIWLIVAGNKGNEASTPAPINKKDDLAQPYETERVVKQNTQAILSAFPDGFPVEAGVESTNSYKYVPANSTEQQSTIEYTSQKSLADNGKIFKDFLTASGFEIINEQTQGKNVFYYGKKDTSDLSILIRELTDSVTVSASYLKR